MKISVRLRNGSLWIAMVLSLMLADLSCTEAGEAGKTNGTSSAADPAQTYRDFLSNPPWIKKIVFRVSGNSINITTSDKNGRLIDGGHIQGWITYEAGIQPNGFYLKYVSLAPDYIQWSFDKNHNPTSYRVIQPPPGLERVMGASQDYYWNYAPRYQMARRTGQEQDLVIAPRRSTPGYSTNESLESHCRLEIAYKIEKLRRLGMPHLADSDAIQWSADGSFSADSHKYGHVQGRILEYENNLPTSIKYSISKPMAITYWVEYQYGDLHTLPPRQIITWSSRDTNNHITNVIDFWEPGLDESHSKGYLPSEFGAGSVPLSTFLVWSNNVPYLLDKNGRMNQAKQLPQNADLIGWISLHALMVLVLLIACLLLAVLSWHWSRRNKPKKLK